LGKRLLWKAQPTRILRPQGSIGNPIPALERVSWPIPSSGASGENHVAWGEDDTDNRFAQGRTIPVSWVLILNLDMSIVTLWTTFGE
jgi:hypothetical protein